VLDRRHCDRAARRVPQTRAIAQSHGREPPPRPRRPCWSSGES
jgi:hypothetical protein